MKGLFLLLDKPTTHHVCLDRGFITEMARNSNYDGYRSPLNDVTLPLH